MSISITKSLAVSCLAATLAAPAFAGIPVSPGNVEQEKCGASRVSPLTTMGVYTRGGSGFNVTDRRSSVGKPLSPGEVLFYASLTETRKVYRTGKQIEIIDASPLTPDVKITPQMPLPVLGIFTADSGRRFDLVGVGTGHNRFIAMVDASGFMCSDRLDERLVAVGAPTVYQELPLVAESADPGLAKPRKQSVAVTFMGLVGAAASFEVSVMVNGVVEARKVSSFDAFAPVVQLGDLKFAIKVEEGKLTVTSLDELTDYGHWLGDLRAGLRR